MSSTFDREAARRLPLAEATFRLLDFVMQEGFLNEVYQLHRGASYEKVIAFPLFVHLVTDALLGHRGSAHQTFCTSIDENALKASVQAMYGKLKRVPIKLSTELFAAAAQRLGNVGLPTVVHPWPATLADFRPLAFDGKKLKYVAKLLKPLRGLKGTVLGGKLLVVQDMRTQQAVAFEPAADGEAADNPLVPAVVARVRALPDPRARLWVGDRAFCDYKLLGLLSEGSDHFVVRFNTSCGFHADATQKARTGKDSQGRPFVQEWGWLGDENNPHRIQVRKITVTRAPKDDPLILVTSLLDASRYPADDVLTAYGARWGIEVMFQQVVQTFDLRHLIGATPQATVFQAMLCLLLYNTTMTVRDYVAAAADQEPRQVSLKLFFDALVRDLTAWVEVIGPIATLRMFAETRIDEWESLRSHLHQMLAHVWTERWRKAPTKKNRPKKPLRAYICGGHSSVKKIINNEHTEIPLGPSPPGTPPRSKPKKKMFNARGQRPGFQAEKPRKP
jgi:hypothetical protein